MDSGLVNPRTGQLYKSPTALAFNHNVKYTPEEDKLLLANTRQDAQLAHQLNRSIDSVQCRRKRIRRARNAPLLSHRFTPLHDLLIIMGMKTQWMARWFGFNCNSVTKRKKRLLAKAIKLAKENINEHNNESAGDDTQTADPKAGTCDAQLADVDTQPKGTT